MWLFFLKQKTAYEMRISDWSSDVCSSDLSFRSAGSLRSVRGKGVMDQSSGQHLQGRRFEGRTGILTGGAKGIGRAAALRFLNEGGRLAVVDTEPEDGTFAAALRRDAGDGEIGKSTRLNSSH